MLAAGTAVGCAYATLTCSSPRRGAKPQHCYFYMLFRHRFKCEGLAGPLYESSPQAAARRPQPAGQDALSRVAARWPLGVGRWPLAIIRGHPAERAFARAQWALMPALAGSLTRKPNRQLTKFPEPNLRLPNLLNQISS